MQKKTLINKRCIPGSEEKANNTAKRMEKGNRFEKRTITQKKRIFYHSN